MSPRCRVSPVVCPTTSEPAPGEKKKGGPMETVLEIALVVAMAAVVAVLAVGVVGLARGDRDPRVAQRLMRARVATQAVALLLVAAVLALRWTGAH